MAALKPIKSFNSSVPSDVEQEDPNSLVSKLRAIIARDQDWETVTLTNYGTVVKYKKAGGSESNL